MILGLLATFVGPKILYRYEEAKRTKARIQIVAFESALKQYKIDNGVYPSTEQGLEALVMKPEIGDLPDNWREGGYLEKNKIPLDPWKNPYVYLSPGEHNDEYDIESYGKDGEDGGEGADADIQSWDLE